MGSADITIRQLRYFVAVAEERNFRLAAARLNLSQPPLTRRIQDLERDLGVELFSRAGNRIELTEAGRFVLAEARATVAQAERVREVARQAGRGEVGSLRMAVVSSALFVPAFREAVMAFQRDHPGVVLDLAQTTSRGALDAFQQRKVDMCVIRRAGPRLDEFHHAVIARDRLMLVLPSNHAKARAEKAPLEEVAKERFMILSNESSIALYRQIMDVWARAGVTPQIALRAENALPILGLVATGFGNAILPSVLQGMRMPNVVWKDIEMDEKWTASAITMIYRTEAPAEKILARFVAYVGQSPPR